jgi:hypothetical protein
MNFEISARTKKKRRKNKTMRSVKISLSFKRFNADDKFVFRVSDTDDDDFSVNRDECAHH